MIGSLCPGKAHSLTSSHCASLGEQYLLCGVGLAYMLNERDSVLLGFWPPGCVQGTPYGGTQKKVKWLSDLMGVCHISTQAPDKGGIRGHLAFPCWPQTKTVNILHTQTTKGLSR